MGTTHSRRLKGGLGDGHRPTDENDAEKAQGGCDCSEPAEPQTNGTATSQPAPSPGLLARLSKALTHSRTEGEGSKPKDSDFREDARIWQLYLEKAEESANEKATLWTTGLDSLLIFAGLFAGIVAGFVIDIRSDLQLDRAPRLLSDILDFLRNVASSHTSSDTSDSVYWIHGLWIVSLFITISSAILGVLAKAWLAKYIPAKNRGTSKDAYHRYKLDIQAERLFLKEVLILAPLLVQLASGLFLAGLVLQALGDVPETGLTLLGLCLVGLIVYFVLTLLPHFVLASPFNTPLSELFHARYILSCGLEPRPPFKPDIDDGLGEILYEELIMSRKTPLIEEVAAEVARGLTPKWIDYLCKNDTPAILLWHLQECAGSRTTDVAKKNEVLGNYLHALLSFAERYEEKLCTGPCTDTRELGIGVVSTHEDASHYKTLEDMLRAALEPGKPLSRWDELPHGVRPLLFALRANILSLLRNSNRSGAIPDKSPRDLSGNELAERPWSMVLRGIPSSHRIYFILAAYSGLVQGEPHLQKTSAFILCLSLAKASFTAFETGETMEWASSLLTKEGRVRTLMLRYLLGLYKVIVSGWEDMAADALQDTSSIEKFPSDLGAASEALMVPGLLLLSFSQPDSNMRVHALKMLKHWIPSVSNLNWPGLVQSIGEPELRPIAGIAVFNDQGMQDDALVLLTELAKVANGTMAELIKGVLVNRILSGLKKYDDPPARMAAIRVLVKLSTNLADKNLFISVMSEVVPKLDDLNDLLKAGLKADHVRQMTVNSSNDPSVDTKALRYAILGRLSQMFDGSNEALAGFLVDLTVVVEKLCAAPSQDLPWPFQSDKEPPWTLPWVHPSAFVREFLDYRSTTDALDMLQKLVKIATGISPSNISASAVKILKLSCTWKSGYFAVLKDSMPPNLSVVLPIPPSQDLGLAARWVKLLASMPPRLLADLRDEDTSSLRRIMVSVKNTVCTQKDAAASEGRPSPGQDIKIKLSHITGLLDQLQREDCMNWIEIFSMISCTFPDEFPDAPDILFGILWHYKGHYLVPLRALDGLLALGKQAGANLQRSVLRNLELMAKAPDWHVRLVLPRLLTDLSDSTKLRLGDNTLTILRGMASQDTESDYDVRSETIKFLTSFTSSSEEFQSRGDTATKDQKNLGMFDQGIQDKDPSPRRSWLKFAVPHIKDADCPRVASIFYVALKDSDRLVRMEASNSLYRLLTKTRASYAKKLAGLIASSFNDPQARYISIASLLVNLTSAGPEGGVAQEGPPSLKTLSEGEGEKLYPLAEFDGTLTPVHDAWVRLVLFLGKHDFPRVSHIIDAALQADASHTFQDAKTAFNNLETGLLTQIRDALPNYLDSALGGSKINDRLESVNLMTSLLRDEKAYGLLGGPRDTHPQLMLRLAEASVKTGEVRLRKSILNLLKSLLTNRRFRESIGRSCLEHMGPYLGGQGVQKHQENIIGILYRLTAADVIDPTIPTPSQEPSDQYASLNEIISPHISLLLNLALLVGERTYRGELRKHAEGILLENLRTYPGRSILIEDVLSAIPAMIPAIPAEGKANAAKIIDTLPVPEGKALSIAHALVPFLRDSSPYARATALELLSRLDQRYRPELIGSATQEIIGLALKDSVDEIRIAAIQLLSALALAAPSQVSAQKPAVFIPTIQLAAQFIPFLLHEALRPSVVGLLSVMALRPPVRRILSLRIMSSSFGPDGASLEAHTELLARLISDGRFLHDSDEATDKVMLFFAPALVTRPELARYRFEILTALWCRYARVPVVRVKRREPVLAAPTASGSPTALASPAEDEAIELEPADPSTAQLVEWFTFAAFGRHATQDEVTKYLTRSTLWLPKPTLHNLQSEVLEPFALSPIPS